MKKNTLFILLLCLMQITTAKAIKIAHGPYLQDVGETEATFVWLSDSTSIGWVELFPDDGSNAYLQTRKRYYDTTIGIKREGKIHSVTIKGLKPGTNYRYRVFAQEVLSHKGIRVHYGDIVATEAYKTTLPKFTTLDTSKPETSFLVVNDIHQNNELLSKLLSMGKVKSRDIVFFNGDMLNIFDSEAKFFRSFMDTAVKEFATDIPLYYVRGNHETRGQWADRFHDYVCPRKPNLYYAFQQGPVYFICLDSGEDKPDTDWEYSGITDYDNYRTEQAEWLKGVVESKEFKNAKFRVVLAHIPPFDNQEPVWHGAQEVNDKFIPILNNSGINLMICGHNHQYAYRDKIKGCDFPIVVNSNHGVVTANTHGDKIRVKVQEADGTVNLEKDF